MRETITIQELANRVCGETLSHARLSPLRWNEAGDVGICEGAVFLTNGLVVPLVPWEPGGEVERLFAETPPELMVDGGELRNDVTGWKIEAVVVALHVCSFGLLVDGGRVVCLDFVSGQDGVYQSLICWDGAYVMDEDAVRFTSGVLENEEDWPAVGKDGCRA